VTKIRNRLGDGTLDDYCFAHHKLKTDRRQETSIISFTLLPICLLILKFHYNPRSGKKLDQDRIRNTCFFVRDKSKNAKFTVSYCFH
jgi:hypothetical protein